MSHIRDRISIADTLATGFPLWLDEDERTNSNLIYYGAFNDTGFKRNGSPVKDYYQPAADGMHSLIAEGAIIEAKPGDTSGVEFGGKYWILAEKQVRRVYSG